jgi:hypothetical protein
MNYLYITDAIITSTFTRVGRGYRMSYRRRYSIVLSLVLSAATGTTLLLMTSIFILITIQIVGVGYRSGVWTPRFEPI